MISRQLASPGFVFPHANATENDGLDGLSEGDRELMDAVTKLAQEGFLSRGLF